MNFTLKLYWSRSKTSSTGKRIFDLEPERSSPARQTNGYFMALVKDKDYCPIEIVKGLTDKGQFQYLTKLMGPQEGTYLYATQFHSLR